MKTHNPSKFIKSKIALALSGALFSTLSMANTIQGKVSNQNHDVFFEGAKVTIKELKRSTVTKRDGSFKLSNLAEGRYTLLVDYLGAKRVEQVIEVVDGRVIDTKLTLESEDKVIEDVIVVGQRAGQAGALNRQKNAYGIKAIVSSDSIGQLPDQNAAEALQRLPGMFIQRDQGEGRFVGIRGIDPNLNNVTINGANVPSPEAGVRSVAMDVIPSELIQSLEVSKTVTPDMDASAIGGSIEVQSLSAFDRDGMSYSANAQATYNKQTSDNSPKLSGSFSDIFSISKDYDLGVATALSWSERKFGSYNMETDGGWQTLTLEDTQANEVSLRTAEEIEQRHYSIKRERLGAALNLDLRDKNANAYYLRTLYSEFSDDEFRLRNEYKLDKGDLIAGSASHNYAQFEGAAMDRDTKDRYESQEILSIVAGAEQQFGPWLVEYSASYSKSDEEEPNRLDASFKGKDLTLGYANLGDYPALTHSADAHDLSNFELDEITFENNLSEDESASFKVDLSKDFVLNNYNAQLKFGAKINKREKTSGVNAIVYDGGFDDILASQFATNAPDYSLGDFGPGLSRSGLKGYVLKNRSAFEINQIDTDINNKGKSYLSEEQINAAYAMITLDMGQWQVISGLRYESTAFKTQGNRVELINDEVNDSERVDISAWNTKKEYNHLLPNLTVRYDVEEDLVTRFAYTSTIARPKFSDSAAFQVIETEVTMEDNGAVTERKAEVGNPDLKPLESNNIDVSVEYYPDGIGVISAGIFYKDIENFITLEQVQGTAPWQGYKKVEQSRNGNSASLTGIELAYSKNFKNGIMVGLNGTFINADDKLPNQSDTVANLMLGYENSYLSTRLSASYKSKNYQQQDGEAQVYQDDHMQLDFSAKYNVTDQTQVYFNAVNLTDEPFHLYHGTSQYSYQYETYGRTFELGVSFNSY